MIKRPYMYTPIHLHIVDPLLYDDLDEDAVVTHGSTDDPSDMHSVLNMRRILKRGQAVALAST